MEDKLINSRFTTLEERMKKVFFVVAMALALSNCSRIASDTPQQLMNEKLEDLTNAYAFNHREEVLQELVRRGSVRPEFSAYVQNGKLTIGMNKAEVLSLAIQQYTHEVNRTVTAAGVTEQWVYENADGKAYLYIYFTNGFVTAYQN